MFGFPFSASVLAFSMTVDLSENARKTQPGIFNGSAFSLKLTAILSLCASISSLLLVTLRIHLPPTRGRLTYHPFLSHPLQSGTDLRPTKPQPPLALLILVRHIATNRSGNVYSGLLRVVFRRIFGFRPHPQSESQRPFFGGGPETFLPHGTVHSSLLFVFS